MSSHLYCPFWLDWGFLFTCFWGFWTMTSQTIWIWICILLRATGTPLFYSLPASPPLGPRWFSGLLDQIIRKFFFSILFLVKLCVQIDAICLLSGQMMTLTHSNLTYVHYLCCWSGVQALAAASHEWTTIFPSASSYQLTSAFFHLFRPISTQMLSSWD